MKAAKPAIQPLDLSALAAYHAKEGTLWTRPAKFDFDHVQVIACALVLDDGEQATVLRFNTYNSCLSLKRQRDLDPADAVPVASVPDLLARLERQGYRVHSPAQTEAPEPKPKAKPKTRRKTAE